MINYTWFVINLNLTKFPLVSISISIHNQTHLHQMYSRRLWSLWQSCCSSHFPWAASRCSQPSRPWQKPYLRETFTKSCRGTHTIYQHLSSNTVRNPRSTDQEGVGITPPSPSLHPPQEALTKPNWGSARFSSSPDVTNLLDAIKHHLMGCHLLTFSLFLALR